MAFALMTAVAQVAQANLIQTFQDYNGPNTVLVRWSYDGSSNNNTWTVPTGVTSVELLVVGGGGGGAINSNGNGRSGGGGGAYYTASYSVTPDDTLNVAVGAGGTGGTGSSSRNGATGGNSLFGTGSTTVIAYGGGGTIYNVLNGTTYGYSGGYSLDNGTTRVDKFAGNNQTGAGAGEAAGNTTGGNGISSLIVSQAFALANALPYDQGYYGGGGGNVASDYLGGLGGGGRGSDTGFTTPGVDGLGGGGGGAGYDNFGKSDGGDGVIYIAYTVIPEPATLSMLGVIGIAMLLRKKIHG